MKFRPTRRVFKVRGISRNVSRQGNKGVPAGGLEQRGKFRGGKYEVGRVPMDRPGRRNTYIEISLHSPRIINSSQFLYQSIYIPSVIPSSKHVSILLLSEMRNRIWKFKTIFENFPPPLNFEGNLLLVKELFSCSPFHLLPSGLSKFKKTKKKKKKKPAS